MKGPEVREALVVDSGECVDGAENQENSLWVHLGPGKIPAVPV